MLQSRRRFLADTMAALGSSATLAIGPNSVGAGSAKRRLRIAALTTIYHKYSHSEHIIDRFLEGYGWENGHHRPEMDVVALYVEQVGSNDLSRERASRHPGMKIYHTIAEALTQGGSSLEVDGVLLIGEHGNYPHNEKGQHFRQAHGKPVGGIRNCWKPVFPAATSSIPLVRPTATCCRLQYGRTSARRRNLFRSVLSALLFDAEFLQSSGASY